MKTPAQRLKELVVPIHISDDIPELRGKPMKINPDTMIEVRAEWLQDLIKLSERLEKADKDKAWQYIPFLTGYISSAKTLLKYGVKPGTNHKNH